MSPFITTAAVKSDIVEPFRGRLANYVSLGGQAAVNLAAGCAACLRSRPFCRYVSVFRHPSGRLGRESDGEREVQTPLSPGTAGRLDTDRQITAQL